MNPNNGHQADTSIGGSQKGTCCLFQQNRDQQQWKQTLNHFWGSSSLVYTGCCLCVVYPEQALKDMMVTTRGNPASARDFVWLREKLTQPQTGGFVGLVFCWFFSFPLTWALEETTVWKSIIPLFVCEADEWKRNREKSTSPSPALTVHILF